MDKKVFAKNLVMICVKIARYRTVAEEDFLKSLIFITLICYISGGGAVG